jgi:hypothetical protein
MSAEIESAFVRHVRVGVQRDVGRGAAVVAFNARISLEGRRLLRDSPSPSVPRPRSKRGCASLLMRECSGRLYAGRCCPVIVVNDALIGQVSPEKP